MTRRIRSVTVLLACLPMLLSCTSNPIGDENIVLGKRKIHGTVTLSDGGSPDSVYVWLRNQNLSTYTDENGDFEFTLPLQPGTGAGTGAIEEDEVFFYLANYYIHQANVMIQDGAFMYDRGDIGINGAFSDRIMMRRFLRITTRVIPQIIVVDGSVEVEVQALLIAEDQCVDATIPYSPPTLSPHNGPLGAIFLRHRETGALSMMRQPSDLYDLIRACPDTARRTLFFNTGPGQFALGTYEVIPYVWVNPPGMSRELLERVSTPHHHLGAAYLQKPMKRSDGLLEVRTELPF